MIQFNLLPDVKLQYIKAKRMKALITTGALIVSAGTVFVALILFAAVNISQKANMNSLNKKITAAASTVSKTKDLDQLITVQNQLTSLPTIHSHKYALTRLYGYLEQLTPKNVTISSATVDTIANTLSITGQADDLHAVNTFVDTIKFTNFTDNPSITTSTTAQPKTNLPSTLAFKNVLLTGFSTDDKKASYQITLVFDPLLFDNQHTINLVVPSITTTRSQQDQPSVLFEQQSPATTKKAGAL